MHKRIASPRPEVEVKPNFIVQLDPDKSEWGALLCIVDEVREWGVLCYAMTPTKRGEMPAQMFMRVKTGDYIVVGVAEWMIQHPPPSETKCR